MRCFRENDYLGCCLNILFMASILSTVIGIIFVMLLFSMLSSTILELIAGFTSLRGKHLIKAIRGMIGSEGASQFIKHPFFRQLAAGSSENVTDNGKKVPLPSYISADTFSSVLLDMLEIDPSTDLKMKIESLPEGPQKQLAMFLYKKTGDDLVAMKKSLEDWYNEVMDRVTGAYKRHTQRYLLIIGFTVAVVFNVDILNVYGNLSTNASLSNQIADQAALFIGNTSRPDSLKLEGASIDSLSQKIQVLLSEDQIGALKAPLGLGWEWQENKFCFCACWSCAGFWVLKLAGWLTTALGISLGATFWFDALKKLVSIRNAGSASVAGSK